MKDTFAYEFEGGLYINLTNRCTNHCVFCLRNTMNGVGDHYLWLSKEPEVQEVITAIEDLGGADRFREVVFCGFGEPTMRLDALREVAKIVKDRWHSRIRLNTNGMANLVYNRDISGELARLVDVVSISLNAPDAAEFIEVSRPDTGPSSFDSLLQFAAACKAKGMDVVFTVVSSLGEEKIKHSRELAERLGVRLRVRELIVAEEE